MLGYFLMLFTMYNYCEDEVKMIDDTVHCVHEVINLCQDVVFQWCVIH